ncbi:MAG: UDP-N-acetylmuramoylalanyl-D-glutamyl-2,6-diaminopimelate--D-alanyl-D-alanine ligase [Alphaproteobacteria bacterium]
MNAAPLWTAAEAAKATGGRATGDWTCAGICSDSRKVAGGDLFVALKGPNHDAHEYVADAFERGAAAALISSLPDRVTADAPLLFVDDVLAGLNRLAHAARERSPAKIFAVTGSVGKTGTKETLKLALSLQGKIFASPASFNNEWGVPLSLAALPRDARYGVFEIGMNHPGEIAPLARMVRPQVGVITNVEGVHLAFFPSVEAVCDAKTELFEGMGEGDVAVLNRDNPFYDRLAEAARRRGVGTIVSFGAHPAATVRLADCTLGAEHSEAAVAVAGETLACAIGAPGRHWVTIGLTVLAAVHAAGGDVAAAAARLTDVKPLPGRGARHRVALDGDGFTLIDESYNANPVSMRAAIENLGATPPSAGGRRIAVLGDMLELGTQAPALHAGLAGPLSAANADLVFTVGPNMAHLRDALPAATRAGHAERSDDIVAPVVAAVGAGDVVMVKGSLGIRMAPVVVALKQRDGAPESRAAGNG